MFLKFSGVPRNFLDCTLMFQMLEAHDGRGRGKKSSDVHDIFCQGVQVFLMLTHKLSAGHPRRHLLTTGWSVFVSSKRLVAGDSVLFLRYVVLQL